MIYLAPDRAAELAMADYLFNPMILWDDRITGIYSPTGDVAGFPATNAQTGDTFDVAKPVVVSQEAYLRWTATGSINCVCVVAHNLADLDASCLVQHSADGTTWTDAGAGVGTPNDNGAIVFRFPERTANHWRFRITQIWAGQPYIGVIMAGVDLVVTRRIYQGYSPATTPTQVNMVPRVSEGGHFLGSTVISQGSTVSARIDNLTPSFLTGAAWKAFQTYANNGGPFFWAWRPQHDPTAFYAKALSPIRPTITGPQKFMGVELNMQLYHDYT